MIDVECRRQFTTPIAWLLGVQLLAMLHFQLQLLGSSSLPIAQLHGVALVMQIEISVLNASIFILYELIHNSVIDVAIDYLVPLSIAHFD